MAVGFKVGLPMDLGVCSSVVCETTGLNAWNLVESSFQDVS